MRILTSLTFLLASVAPAQNLFEKAPPQVEQALRERVAKFYQAHVDSKFRQADLLVAEDSKDSFFAMSKLTYKKFEFLKATYTDNFTKATVVTVVERDMIVRGNTFPSVKAPVTTTWKVIDGQWFWYVDEEASKHADTPMGRMNAGATEPARPAGMPADFSRMINDPARRAELVESIRNKVAISKTEITFPFRKSASETIDIANGLDGPIDVEMEMIGKVAGLTAKLGKPSVPAGGKIQVILKYVPGKEATGKATADKESPDKDGPKPSASLTIRVSQTGQTFKVAIAFNP